MPKNNNAEYIKNKNNNNNNSYFIRKTENSMDNSYPHEEENLSKAIVKTTIDEPERKRSTQSTRLYINENYMIYRVLFNL